MPCWRLARSGRLRGEPTLAHAATTCDRSTRKRVVKHVKRHGKRKKVVRLKHYWTCQEVATPAPRAASGAPPGAGAPPSHRSRRRDRRRSPNRKPTRSASSPTIAAGTTSYDALAPAVRAGKLTVQLINKGEDPHDMDIQRVGPGDANRSAKCVKVPVTDTRREHGRVTVEVQPGRYRMWCDLFHHAEEGMEATVTVE